ncbi:MAG: hypothetical protein HYY00_00545 [Chloroflexi bacterium]|nr:hypothetical protein [Chloroflexota bacterium]
MAQTIRILSPVGIPQDRRDGNAERLDSLSGKTLGIMSNGWRSFLIGMERLEEVAVSKHEAGSVIKALHTNASGPAPAELLEEMAKKGDAAIVGLGH